jgi:hypothetical protein
VHDLDGKAVSPVDPCQVMEEPVRQDLQIQFLQVSAERDQWVFPLVDIECGASGTLDTSSFVADVPAGNLQYVAKLRGTLKNGSAVCSTVRSPELVSRADRDLHVTMLLSDSNDWGCEDDLFHCTDGSDNDGDKAPDCSDDDCSSFCGEFGVDACSDGLDNDGDGTIDCEDHGCVNVGAVCESGNVTCSDGLDNDDDDATDCDDDDCAGFCEVGTECKDDVDNDGDGDIDCGDEDCASFCELGDECKDDVDNDGDGDIDCDDEDCGCGPRRNPVRMGR